MKVGTLVPITGNFLLCLLGIAWAYTSYRYNLLNVGGGVGDVTLWDSASEVVSMAFLSAWALALIAILTIGLVNRIGKVLVSLQILATLVLSPSVFFLVSWLLHRGFPPSPV